MKINYQSLPTRCEICHQSDCFNAALNQCSRCNGDHKHVAIEPYSKQDRRQVFVGLIWLIFSICNIEYSATNGTLLKDFIFIIASLLLPLIYCYEGRKYLFHLLSKLKNISVGQPGTIKEFKRLSNAPVTLTNIKSTYQPKPWHPLPSGGSLVDKPKIRSAVIPPPQKQCGCFRCTGEVINDGRSCLRPGGPHVKPC